MAHHGQHMKDERENKEQKSSVLLYIALRRKDVKMERVRGDPRALWGGQSPHLGLPLGSVRVQAALVEELLVLLQIRPEMNGTVPQLRDRGQRTEAPVSDTWTGTRREA